MKRSILLAALTALSILAIRAQGPLNPPPGPPAPTLKTLQQVEPRTEVPRLPFTIKSPGSYYLAADLTGAVGRNGITVDADDVSINLNGFTLRGVAGSLNGILILGARRNVSVRDGVVRDWGESGISGSADVNSQFLNLRLTGNRIDGLSAATGCQVRNCVAEKNSGSGIRVGDQGQVTEALCHENGTGIVAGERAALVRCQVTGSTNNGIEVGNGSRVRGSTASANGQIGISAADGSFVLECTVESNSSEGIQVTTGCVVRANTCRLNGLSLFGAGVRVTGNENRLEENHLTGADRGLWITGTKNHVAGNTVQGNTENYVLVAGNHLNLLISEIPQSIDWPASVELAGTLTGITAANGITINSSDVTLDLKGHSLVGVAGSLDGIHVMNQTPDHTNITIRNGIVKDWGGDGIDAEFCQSGSVKGLKVSTNGEHGIRVGGSSLSTPRAWIVEGCQAVSNGMDGINVNVNALVSGCVASFNTMNGIRVMAVCIVRDCVTQRNQGSGIRAQNDNIIVNNTCDDNDVDGIRLTSGDCRVDSNHVTDNDGVGINATTATASGGNLIIRNTAADNTTNYMFVANNSHGPVVDVRASDDISATPGADHPWANFEF